ncbi:ribosomal protein L16p/L10e [Astrocystis sublimbata]|nr:ribosomal protein L16p/L10e [Astrocystis sublimbata]
MVKLLHTIVEVIPTTDSLKHHRVRGARRPRIILDMRSNTPSCLLGAFRSLTIAHTPTTRPSIIPCAAAASRIADAAPQHVRLFSASAAMAGSWLEPALDRKKKMMKGRVRCPTNGSTKGTTVVWGDYGMRMTDHGRRISAAQLKMAEDTIKARLRGQKYRLYKRICCNLGVYVSGNEMRMGKGKGSFDHWAARVAVNQICLELRGVVHEQVVRDAFRLAGNKLPGQWEFVKRGEAPYVGITKLDGVTLEELRRPRRKIAAESIHPIPPPIQGSESGRSPLDLP